MTNSRVKSKRRDELPNPYKTMSQQKKCRTETGGHNDFFGGVFFPHLEGVSFMRVQFGVSK